MDSTLIDKCLKDFAHANFRCEPSFLIRFVASLKAKPFVILTGMSGSGKTKIAHCFANWISTAVSNADPFPPGVQIGNSYRVTNSDAISVEFSNSTDEKVVLPRGLIDEWAEFLLANPTLTGEASPVIRAKFKEFYENVRGEKYAKHAILWDTHLKPAALAVIGARKGVSNIGAELPYVIVAVGADWTSNEYVLGYPDALDEKRFIKTKTLDLLLRAASSPEVPHFLILDEMNLSHVERYFSEVLSAMESGQPIHLHGDNEPRGGVPSRISIPPNFFIIGTVNVDETTYMFSPKVLDRANVLEFRVNSESIGDFLDNPDPVADRSLTAKGSAFSKSFVSVKAPELTNGEAMRVKNEILTLFNLLEPQGSAFGFRVAKEIVQFVRFHKTLSGQKWKLDEAFDAQIAQKILPKLHGSRSALEPILWGLATFAHESRDEWTEEKTDALIARASEAFKMEDDHLDPLGKSPEGVEYFAADSAAFPVSFEKITRMIRRLRANGFTSFAEG